jgi:transposase
VDEQGKPVQLLLSEGQMSDYKGARQLLAFLPDAKVMIADRGYDADWFRQALKDKNITPCIPPKKNRRQQILYDTELYKKRHKVENMFAKLKDWRRIATRYDRCAHTFFSAICIAATFCFYLN